MLFKKVTAQIEKYTSKLTKNDFEKDAFKVEKEIKDIEKNYTLDKRLSVEAIFDNKKYKLFEFLKLLKQKLSELKEIKDVKGTYDSFLFHDIGGKNMDVSTYDSRESLKRDIKALERQIISAEQSLANIDNYVVSLLTGESAKLNLFAHTYAKFVKTANDDMQKEADEEIEDYYNDLYQDSEGSPDYGTALEHPEETKNQLTTKIHHHRFRKK